MPGKILVIDDEILILNTVEKALAKAGYHVTSAQNTQELETALRDAPFDLMITDLHMEDDSVENIISRVKRSSPSIKILLISGSADRSSTDNFLEKPFKIDELREKVGSLLNEPS
jgi:DNA-binding NtrC family response regulator